MSEYICTECHYMGKPKSKKPGSTGMEIFMWSMFPLGLPYTFWRIIKKIKVCANCGSSMITDTESPMGARLVENIENNLIRKPITQRDYMQFVEKAKYAELTPFASPAAVASKPQPQLQIQPQPKPEPAEPRKTASANPVYAQEYAASKQYEGTVQESANPELSDTPISKDTAPPANSTQTRKAKINPDEW